MVGIKSPQPNSFSLSTICTHCEYSMVVNLVKFRKWKCTLPLVTISGTRKSWNSIWKALLQRDLRVLADKSNKIQQTIPLQRSTASWAALSSVTSRSREVIFPLCTALVHKCSAVSPHGLPVDLLEWVQQMAMKISEGFEGLTYEERQREPWLISLKKRKLRAVLSICVNKRKEDGA